MGDNPPGLVERSETERSGAERRETSPGDAAKNRPIFPNFNTVLWTINNHQSQGFFKNFKSKEEFQSFFTDLYKQGVEEMLKGELNEHLGYEKHSKEGYNTGNSRNGFYPKK